VLLDLRMPDIDGWGVLDFISKLADPPRVVIVSGYNEVVPPGHLAHCVGGYVHKPFDVHQLVKTCDAVLAVELVVPASGSRREARRRFIVQAVLLSEDGIPLMTGEVQNISRMGMQIEVMMRYEPGDSLRVQIQLPDAAEPLVAPGRVAWRSERAVGVELRDLNSRDEQRLRDLLEPEEAGGPAR
jgi:CheY-like chemotaxis protein